MTAILLHTIFITALSRAFGTACWKQLANPPVDSGAALTNCTHSAMTKNLKSEGLVEEDALQGSSFEDTKVELFDGDAQQNEGAKFYHSLSRRYQEVASIVDTFAATYQSAYRWVWRPRKKKNQKTDIDTSHKNKTRHKTLTGIQFKLRGYNGSSGNEATLDTVPTPSLSRPAEGIASLISLAADCLRHPDGHLYYIGASVFGILGYSTIVVAIGDGYPRNIPYTLQYHCHCYWRQLSYAPYSTTVVAIGDGYPIHLTVPLSLLLETVIPYTLQYHCRCYWRRLSHTPYSAIVVAIGDSYPIHLTVPFPLLLETVIPYTLQYHFRCYWRQLSHTPYLYSLL